MVSVTDSAYNELALDLSEKLVVEDTKGKKRESISRTTRTTRLVSMGDDCSQDSRSSDGTTAIKTARRTVSTASSARPAKSMTRSKTEESLVTELQDKLTLQSQENERGRTKSTRDEDCVDAMRAINAVSKALSAIISSGWKANAATDTPRGRSIKATSTGLSVSEHCTNARRRLQLLRELKPGDLDIERATVNLAGKLNTLETVRAHYSSCLRMLTSYALV